MLDLLNSDFAIPAAVLIAIIALIVIGQAQQQSKLAAKMDDILTRSREERQRTYAQAKKSLDHWKKVIRKKYHKDAIVIDLVCDLGDQWEDRDAPRYISYEQAIQAQQQIQPLLEAQKRPKDLPTLVVILHTLGGYSHPSQMIASAIAAYGGPKIAYVPYIAMSGGTKAALACEKIVMGPTACLGPIDTQYSGYPNEALQSLRSDDKASQIPASVLLLMREAKKHDAFAVQHAKKVVHPNHTKSKTHENVAEFLASGAWSHGRSIFVHDAKHELGLNIKVNCPREVSGFVDARIRMIDTQIEQEAKAPLVTVSKAEDEPAAPSKIARMKVMT